MERNTIIKIAISLFVSLSVYFIISAGQLPYKMELDYSTSGLSENFTYIFEDLDFDGIPERILIDNRHPTFHHIVLIKKYNDVENHFSDVVVQFNFPSLIEDRSFAFEDLNDDGYKELITYTKENDSLFIWIADISRKKWIMRRNLLFARQKNARHPFWDIFPVHTLFADVSKDGKKEIIIGFHSGISQKPRGVLILDPYRNKITKKILFESALSDMQLFDMDGDGRQEIILSGHAVGNISSDNNLNDQQNVLRVLNLNLKPFIKPYACGEHPSNILVVPFLENGNRFLLLVENYLGSKNNSSAIRVMNSSGRIIKEIKWPKRNAALQSHYSENNSTFFIIDNRQLKQIFKLNTNLDIVKKTAIENYGSIVPGFEIERHTFLLRMEMERLLLLDTNLKTVGMYLKKSEETSLAGISYFYKELGTHKNNLLLVGRYQFYSFLISKNGLSLYLILLIPFLSLLIYFSITGTELWLTKKKIRETIIGDVSQTSQIRVFVLNGNRRVWYLNHNAQYAYRLRKHQLLPVGEFNSLVSSENKGVEKKWMKTGFSIGGLDYEDECLVHRIIILKRIFYIISHQPIMDSETSRQILSWSKGAQKIAHDIKTPVSTIILNMDALKHRIQSKGSADDDISDDIEMIQSELERIRKMTKYFMSFAKLQTPQFENVEIKDLVNSVLERFEKNISKDISIKREYSNDTDRAWCDRQQISFVLQILIENSFDALNGKGRIFISSELLDFPSNNGRKYVQIEIADTGSGVPEEIKEKIFLPNFTTKSDGNGMGLAIARMIVLENGGDIGLYSRENFGTVFRFTLPDKGNNGS